MTELELATGKFELLPESSYHEDMGSCVFISFSRDEGGNILGEPPEFACLSGYMEDGFDAERWTHFLNGSLNFMFEGADPVNFPRD